jgi:hypothetical protein
MHVCVLPFRYANALWHGQDEQQTIASLAAAHVGNDADGDDVPSEAVLPAAEFAGEFARVVSELRLVVRSAAGD